MSSRINYCYIIERPGPHGWEGEAVGEEGPEGDPWNVEDFIADTDWLEAIPGSHSTTRDPDIRRVAVWTESLGGTNQSEHDTAYARIRKEN